MSEYLLLNTSLPLLFARLELLKLDCFNLMTARSTNGNDWVDLIYANVNTLNSFLETKTILKNTFNKCLGRSHLLRFLILFLVDLKQRRNTRIKDNREVWNRVPLWLCFINILYYPLPEGSFVWGNQAADVCLYLISTLAACFTSLFRVTWCWSHFLYLQSFGDTRPDPKAAEVMGRLALTLLALDQVLSHCFSE